MVDSRRVDRIATLLIADIEGSTAFRSAVGDELAQGCIDGVLRTIGDAVSARGGEVVKAMGDGVLALFEAPGPAFDAAVRIQRAMVDSDVKVRIGVHAGQLKLAENDVHGMAVHVADRVTHSAAGGEIVVSAMARALASPEPRWRWSDRGPQTLRGLAEPVPVYELVDARPTNDALYGRGPAAELGSEPEPVLEPPLAATRTLTPRSLPRYRTSLVGRDKQLVALASLLHPSTIVTLTGVGGAGKTRMAVELASRTGDRWPDDASFVDLASVADEGLVPNAALAALGLDEEPVRPPLDTFVRAVAQREMLVVVDNCEHVRAAAGELVETLLDAAPGSAVLTTSREPLGLAGERVWPVPPLGRGGADSDAVVLLVERARAANPSFELGGDAEVLAERLEGLPLAIEMIAPWTRSLSTAEIIERIDQLLAIGDRSGTGRQQTMTAVLDWSDRLLEPSARRAFRWLGVFLGDFDLAAAEAVLADDQGNATSVLAELARLVDCSLVVAEPAGTVVRYRLLEPIRQYARRRLAEDGDEGRARERHLDHYLALAREVGRHANGADLRTWFARADQELSNLRAAHDWALTAGRADQAASLAAALYWYWWIRAASSEGIDRLTRALALGPTRAVAARARIGLATMLHQAGRRAEAESEADAARQDAEAAGDGHALARALGTLGRLAVDRGDVAAGNARLGAAARLYEGFGNGLGLAWIHLIWHANALLEGDQELAARRLDTLDRLFTEGASAWGMASASWLRGVDAAQNGDLEQALVRLRDANRLVDDNRLRDETAANAKSWLAAVLTRLGHHAEARPTLTEALVFLEGLPDPTPRAYWCLSFAEASAAIGQHELVLRALGARATVDTQTVLPTMDDPVRAELLAADARRAVGDARAEALLRSGASDPDLRRLLAALGERPAQPSPPSRLERVVLRRDGAMWEVGPDGATFRLPDRKGVRALSYLVAHPSVEVHALELTAVIEGTGGGAVDGLGTGPLLDSTAKAAYRERIGDLQDEIDEADRDHDPARAERARIEVEALTDQLAAAVGLGGRDRPSGVLAERARVNVTRVIRDAIARIAQHDPGLGHHLNTCTHTGIFCSYEPPPAGGPEWTL
jgi:non-specific serine/threonine protein kinase